MTFLELAKERYSARKYSALKVEKAKLDAILEAGRVAPTAANKQPQRILVVQQKDGLGKIGETANVYGAPLALIVCGDTTEAWTRAVDGKPFVDIDVSVVTVHMMMAATDLGLGSVWIGMFDPASIKKNFNLADGVEPISILAIGYAIGEAPSPERHANTRKSLEQTVGFETF